MTTVTLSGVSKRYPNGFEAVPNLDLKVQSGELIALVGPSGCGKSTILRMIAGLEEISSGALLINEREANHWAPKERGIGMVFQSYALYPHMTVRENISFGLKLQKLPPSEIEERVSEVAEQLKIEALLDRKPKQMSGGQRQRVAMARAIARRPEIFLFDEPLSNLDAQLRAQMRVEISRLHRRFGATSFYVTHDQVEAMTLADRVVLLRAGEIQQVGTPLELHDRPSNRFVATFIGSPTMNIIRGARVAEGVSALGGVIKLPDAAIASLESAGVRLGDPLDLGVRPHQLTLLETREDQDESNQDESNQAGAVDRGVIKGRVEVIEPLGSETIIYVRPDEPSVSDPDQLLVVRVESQATAERDQPCALNVSVESSHLFKADERGERVAW